MHRAYRKYFAKDDGTVLVWKGTTAEMNPGIDPAVIAAAYEEDPTSAASEFGAEFRDDVTDFVSRDVVEAVTVPSRFELPPVAGVQYFGFVDPSGGSADSMTLAVAHREGDTAVLDAVREVRPPFSPEAVVTDFAALLKSYRVGRVVGDRYGGEWPREQFRKAGVEYSTSDRAKSEIYRECLPLLNAARVELLDLPRLASQFVGLERRTARGGRDSVDHQPGGHDDAANAAAGALLLAARRDSASNRTIGVFYVGGEAGPTSFERVA